jgi:hypothetical protein
MVSGHKQIVRSATEQMTTVEIARELGITRNQVRHALKLGLAKLARNPRMARLYVSQWRAPVSGNVGSRPWEVGEDPEHYRRTA